MKDIVKMIKSFLLFDLPLQVDVISNQFAITHDCYQKQFVHWSFTATRKKLISDFWLRFVLRHYFIILGLAVVIILPLTQLLAGRPMRGKEKRLEVQVRTNAFRRFPVPVLRSAPLQVCTTLTNLLSTGGALYF